MSSSEDGDSSSSYDEYESLPTWQQYLKAHPIFSSKAAAAGGHPGPDKLPPSPSLQPIGRDVSGLSMSTGSTYAQSALASAASTPQPAQGGSTAASGLAHQGVMAVVRDAELLLAVGSQLRIASIPEVKSNVEAHAADENSSTFSAFSQSGKVGQYKVFDLPEITWPILSIVPSPTNPKLVALVGLSQVVVIVLPRRKDWSTPSATAPSSSSSSHTSNPQQQRVECRRSAVGEFFHGPASTPISSVKWHPLGFKGASLCVLTRDAVLREYDMSTDSDTPVATLDFRQANLSAPSSSSHSSTSYRSRAGAANRSTSKFSFTGLSSPSRSSPRNASNASASTRRGLASLNLDDSDEDLDDADAEATSLCFGSGAAWGPFTAYCLMSSGDVYVASPFIPHSAAISTQHIERLREHLVAASGDEQPDPDATLSSTPAKSPSGPTSTAIKFAAALQEQAKRYAAMTPRPNILDESGAKGTGSAANNADLPDQHVKIMRSLLPKTLPRLRRQGPVLLQPAPRELPGPFNSEACDIIQVSYSLKQSNPKIQPLCAFVIAYSDGKVDVCLELAPAEPRFEAQGAGEPPFLMTYETIDLGLSTSAAAQQGLSEADLERALDSNIPVISQDPIYPDVVYIQHVFGVHSLCFVPWMAPLAAALDSDDERQAEKALTQAHQTRVTPELITMSMSSQPLPVAGLAVVTDIYLGYTLLMLTSFYQLFAKERPLVTEKEETSTNMDLEDKPLDVGGDEDEQASATPYVSLLEPQHFEPPAPLNQPSHVMSGPRFALPPGLTTDKGVKVTPEALRFLGRTIETLRTSMHDLVNAGAQVQDRFEKQTKELSRQLNKLSELHDSSMDAQENSEAVSERIAQAQERQKELVARSDRVLQKLLDARQPELSTFEVAWFEELEHMQGQVSGDGHFGTLQSRLEKITGQVKVLQAQHGKMDQSQLNRAGSQDVAKMGKSQLQRVEAMLDIEGQALQQAKQKVQDLQSRADEHNGLQR